MEIAQRFVNGHPITEEEFCKIKVSNPRTLDILHKAEERARRGIKPVQKLVNSPPEKEE